MSSKIIALLFLFVFLFLIAASLIPSIANCQVTNYYSTTRDYNQVAFTLTTILPTDNSTYTKNLPIQFNLIWNISLESLLADHQPVKGYAYTIDNNQLVNLTPNGTLDVPTKQSCWFNYSIDISSLAQGNHKISIIAYQYYANMSCQGLFNQTSIPIAFSVDNTIATKSPTSTVPEVSWLMILPLFVATFLIATTLKKKPYNLLAE